MKKMIYTKFQLNENDDVQTCPLHKCSHLIGFITSKEKAVLFWTVSGVTRTFLKRTSLTLSILV